MAYPKEYLDNLAYQHDLDCGGYEWSEPSIPEMKALGAVVWEDCDFDYLTGETPEEARGECANFFMVTGYEDIAWPETYETSDGDTYRRIEVGCFYEGDHECLCHGKPTQDGDWQSTGDYRDPPYPKCHRCEGEGLITRDAASYAVYIRAPDSDD